MAENSILVVDGAQVMQHFMRLILTHEGYRVRTAGHAAEALEMFETYCPELIVADLNLPDMDGLELTRRVKTDPRTPHVKVVALMAAADPQGESRLWDAGCDGVISKPFDAQTLTRHVRETLDGTAPPARPAGPKPAQAAAAVAAQTGLSGQEFEHMRRTFLKEGAERSAELLENLDSGRDAASAGALLHSWSGTGGLMGFPEITRLARGCEEMLRSGKYQSAALRECLSSLALTFAELAAANAIEVPNHVMQSLKGKRTALVGLTPERADFLCAALEHVHARPRLYTLQDADDFEAITQCDLVIFQVRPESMTSSWLDPSATVPGHVTLVLAGDRRDLLNLPPAVQSRDVEFLVDTWHTEEVLMRLHLAVSRRTAAVAAKCAAPPTRDEAAPPAEMARERQAAVHASIVIADDDKLVVTVVGSTLQNYGLTCAEALNGEEALRLIRENRPRLAVLDVNMPGLDGFEVLAAIRKENLPVKVVLLTARQREDDVLRGFQLGADDYMVKPFNSLELVARLRRLLRK